MLVVSKFLLQLSFRKNSENQLDCKVVTNHNNKGKSSEKDPDRIVSNCIIGRL